MKVKTVFFICLFFALIGEATIIYLDGFLVGMLALLTGISIFFAGILLGSSGGML